MRKREYEVEVIFNDSGSDVMNVLLEYLLVSVEGNIYE